MDQEAYHTHQSGKFTDSPNKKLYEFSNPECKKNNADSQFRKTTELHCGFYVLFGVLKK